MKYHYVYYSYEEWGRGYIGQRGCNCLPEKDVKYLGSFRDKGFKPTKKIILQTFKTREEALIAEVLLHSFYEVDINPHFANKAKQTATKFKITRHSKEFCKKISQMQTGRKASAETRKKMSESQKRSRNQGKGSMSKEAKKKWLENRSGIKSPCYGKRWWNNGIEQKFLNGPPMEPGWTRGCLPLSEERKQSMREMHQGKVWWTDGEKIKHSKEAPGPNWYRKYPPRARGLFSADS
jgi:hypothetical protein